MGQIVCAWDAVWKLVLSCQINQVYIFIPALIDAWKAKGHCKDFLNFDKLEAYKDFGGIRIEDDLLITKDGCRFIGKDRIPYHPKDIEAFMAANQ